MKHGVKPTRAQRKLLEQNKLDTYDYLVVKDLQSGFLFRSVSTNKEIVLYSDRKGVYESDGVTLLS